MALCGLIVLILSIGYPKKLIFDAELEVIKVEAEKDRFLQKQVLLNYQIKTAKESFDADSLNDEEKLNLQKAVVEHNILRIDLESSTKKMKQLTQHIREVSNYGLIGSMLSSIFMVCGFSLWYTRVQKPADTKAIQDTISASPPTPAAQPPLPSSTHP